MKLFFAGSGISSFAYVFEYSVRQIDRTAYLLRLLGGDRADFTYRFVYFRQSTGFAQ
jgi:hypothetical protein